MDAAGTVFDCCKYEKTGLFMKELWYKNAVLKKGHMVSLSEHNYEQRLIEGTGDVLSDRRMEKEEVKCLNSPL